MGDVRLDLSGPPHRARNVVPLLIVIAGVLAVVALALGVALSPFGANAAKPRPASAEGLRFWSSGDSTSYYVSVSLTQTLTELGAIPLQASPEYQNGSGLRARDFFDWPTYIRDEVVPLNPDLVFFMIGANDATEGLSLDEYRTQVASIMDDLRRDGRYVAWIGEPNMADPARAAVVLQLNEIFRSEAARRPWVRYVDTWDAASDASGAYAATLPDENGVEQQIRADDGLHFTAEGGRRLARVVLAELFDLN